MALIALKEYAERVGRSHKTVYAKYKNNGFKTAQKIGHIILIDENEPFVDGRVKSGLYRNWRKDIEAGKARRSQAQAQAQTFSFSDAQSSSDSAAQGQARGEAEGQRKTKTMVKDGKTL